MRDGYLWVNYRCGVLNLNEFHASATVARGDSQPGVIHHRPLSFVERVLWRTFRYVWIERWARF